MVDNRIITGVVIALLIVAVLAPRVFDLDTFRTADEKRWEANISNFTNQLAHGHFDKLVQQPHPGITTQWLGSLTIYNESWAMKKLPLAVGQSLLILMIGYVFYRLWGKAAGAVLVLLLAFNPLLIAHTRIYAMDSLMALFIVLSIGLLLLWRHNKEYRYLAFSGLAAGAAIMSKLPAVAIVPVVLLMMVWWLKSEQAKRKMAINIAVWLLFLGLGVMIVLPSAALAPGDVWGDFMELFASDDYQQMHAMTGTYYLGSLFFFSTPIQWLIVLALPLIWLLNRYKNKGAVRMEQIIWLLLLAAVFVVQMSLGAKKGDRYILPSFVLLDVVATGVIVVLLKSAKWKGALVKRLAWVLSWLLLIALAWQMLVVAQLHPYELAYVNPITKTWFGERRHGWGEGLDLAAEYLNEKNNVEEMVVASFYPSEFGVYFNGEAVKAHRHDEGGIDYVVLYRAMLQRGDEAWETDVFDQYREKAPEKIIYFQGLPWVWIHAINPSDAGSD